MMKCTVSISFEPQLMAAVNEYCAGKGCSRSWLVNKALTEYFASLEDASLEDQEDYETAVTVLDEFEKSGCKGYTSEEIRDELLKEYDIENLNPRPNPHAKKLKNQK